MTIRTGSTFTIEVSDDDGTTWTFVEEATNWRGGGQRQNQEFARFHNDAKYTLPGQRSYAYTFDMMYDDTDPGQEILRTAEDDETEIMIRITKATGVGFRQVVKVGTIEDNNDPENPQRQTVNLTGTAARLPYAAA